MALRDPTSGLVRALEAQRRVRRQIALLVMLVAACGAWWLAPINEPQPLTGIVIGTGALVLVVEFLVDWSARDAAGEYADDLILTGFVGASRRSPIDRAVSGRIERMEEPRSRQRLATALRWRVRLAQGSVLPSPGMVRACAYPPLGVHRGVYLAQAPLILAIAQRIEGADADPRALIVLRRLITTPPPITVEPREFEQEVRRSFELAASLLGDDASRG
jgi:hypothetical protein